MRKAVSKSKSQTAGGEASDELDDEGEARLQSRKLVLKSWPVSLSFATVHGATVADPTAEERELAAAVFTVTCNERGELVEVFKPGGSPISHDVLKGCLAACAAHGKEVRKRAGSLLVGFGGVTQHQAAAT